MTLRVVAARICIPLMIFQQTIHHDFVYIRSLIICHMLLQA